MEFFFLFFFFYEKIIRDFFKKNKITRYPTFKKKGQCMHIAVRLFKYF